jgi:hypothetical protein
MQPHEIKAYYQQVTAIDIGEVARDLYGERITDVEGTLPLVVGLCQAGGGV